MEAVDEWKTHLQRHAAPHRGPLPHTVSAALSGREPAVTAPLGMPPEGVHTSQRPSPQSPSLVSSHDPQVQVCWDLFKNFFWSNASIQKYCCLHISARKGYVGIGAASLRHKDNPGTSPQHNARSLSLTSGLYSRSFCTGSLDAGMRFSSELCHKWTAAHTTPC